MAFCYDRNAFFSKFSSESKRICEKRASIVTKATFCISFSVQNRKFLILIWRKFYWLLLLWRLGFNNIHTNIPVYIIIVSPLCLTLPARINIFWYIRFKHLFNQHPSGFSFISIFRHFFLHLVVVTSTMSTIRKVLRLKPSPTEHQSSGSLTSSNQPTLSAPPDRKSVV